MKIGLLIIGNEILEGKISDANTRQLALFLRDRHLELSLALTVSDEESAIHQGLQSLFESCDVVMTSGGLGPTKDDVTKQTIASWLGRSISFSEAAFNVAQKNYDRFKREFAGKEHGYCFLPEGFVALDNSTGFAPALWCEHQGKFLLCGAGVPREFKSMLEDHFESMVQKHFPASTDLMELVTVRTRGIPEEKIFNQLDVTLWNKLEVYGGVSSLPTILGVDIGVKLKASSDTELRRMKSEVLSIFEQSPVKQHIWQIGNRSLEELVVEMANQKNISYGFAESATGGLCSHRVTSVSGSSKTFIGSVICYSEKVKIQNLGVLPETIQNFSVVSEPVAGEMAEGLSRSLKTQIAVSITGLAGPTGGTTETPVGTAYIGVHVQGKTRVQHVFLPGDRDQLKTRFSQMALYLLLEELEKSA